MYFIIRNYFHFFPQGIMHRIIAKNGPVTADRKKRDVDINVFNEIKQVVSISSNHTHVLHTLFELVIACLWFDSERCPLHFNI